jgi:hypothetical protein
MYVIAFFGLLMMLISLVMIARPQYWSGAIVKFSEKPWFHPFEIVTRLGFGLAFYRFAGDTASPDLMRAIGFLLMAVALGLLLTPPAKHRQFAVWSAHRFAKTFRPMGVISFLFGAFLVQSALGILPA